MSLGLKMQQPAPTAKQIRVMFPNVHKQQPVIFITMFSPQAKVAFGGQPGCAGGLCPSQVGLAAWTVWLVARLLSFWPSPSLPWCWDLNQLYLSWAGQPNRVFSSHLLCSILSSDNSFCLFHIRTCAVCSLRSSETTSANKYFIAMRYLVSIAICNCSGNRSLCSFARERRDSLYKKT